MCIIQVGMNFPAFQEKLAETLASMGREVDLLLKSALFILRFEPEVEEALVHAYGTILDLCREASRMMLNEKGEERSGLVTFVNSLVHTFDTKFGRFVKGFNDNVKQAKDKMVFGERMRNQYFQHLVPSQLDMTMRTQWKEI